MTNIPVLGYEELYEVTPDLEIYSIRKKRILKKTTSFKGYHIVGLFKDGKQRLFFFHRIIAKAFIPNPDNKPFINHKNGIKTDNRLENLEWVTCQENIRHSYKNGLQIPPTGGACHSAKLTLDITTGIYYDTMKQASVSRGIKYHQAKSNGQKFGLIYV